MQIKNIVQIGTDEYVVKTKQDLITLSKTANIGARAICLTNKAVYVYMELNKWSTLGEGNDSESGADDLINVAEVGM